VTETDEARGKGRPTPKRSAAQAARKKPLVAAKAPRGRAAAGGKAGKEVAREAARARRTEAADARARMREAMKTGDERNYPPMAAGPERAVVRDVIDRRRSFGWLAIPGWFVGVVLTLVPTPATRAAGSLLFPLVIGIIIADSVIAARSVGKALDARWPDGTEVRRRSLLGYGIVRNTQFRRQRMPRPRVERGSAEA
jgi:hypothetical protein